jgi:predicted AlkP superfamily pyrophosphatase or phosphodiesterase
MTHAGVFLRPATPERWHVRDDPRAGDLLLVAAEGWVLARHATDRPSVPGVHGYDPALPDMQGIFLAMGPNVRPRGLIPAFANVDVYPFLAALLRLRALPPIDGSAVTLNDIVR